MPWLDILKPRCNEPSHPVAAVAPKPPITTRPDKLTPHFTVAELTISQEAVRKGISNEPADDVIARLRFAAVRMEKVRELLGGLPITVSSGYRSPAVNKAVGGAKNSAHMAGYAVDFICPQFGTPLEIARVIAASDLFNEVDQLIHEYGRWVHISFDPKRRRELLTISAAGKRVGLHPV